MRRNIAEEARGATVILDGGMGSMLIARGLPPGTPPDAWNVERPDVVQEVHRAYLAAGSQLIYTNTFGASRVRLASAGLERKVEQINRAGARLAVACRSKNTWVAGDLGPTGAFLPPVGTVSPAELEEAFAEQASHLAGEGVDLLVIETMTDLREALAALKGARSVCALVIAACLTFRLTPRGYFTVMGDPAQEALRRLVDEGADIVGTNCTLASSEMVDLVREVAKQSSVPVLAKPNAGQPQLAPEGVSYPEGPQEFARNMMEMAASGAALLGGCCGSTPDHIRAMSELMCS